MHGSLSGGRLPGDHPDVTPALPATFPIFPLPSVILVPEAALPLHVFEPRYRQMVADVLASHRHLAMAMPLPLRDGEDPERPRVHPVVGLGRVVQHRAYPDGRSDVVLAGVARMRILREVGTDRLYRTVVAAEVPDVVAPADEGTARSVRALLDADGGLSAEERDALLALPPGRLADLLLLRLPVDAREKHRIHANPRVDQRIAEVVRALARLGGSGYPREIGPGDPRLN